MEVDISEGFSNSIEIVMCSHSYRQIIDYMKTPFKCVRYHTYGHVEEQCSFRFIKKAWKKIHYQNEVNGGLKPIKGELVQANGLFNEMENGYEYSGFNRIFYEKSKVESKKSTRPL